MLRVSTLQKFATIFSTYTYFCSVPYIWESRQLSFSNKLNKRNVVQWICTTFVTILQSLFLACTLFWSLQTYKPEKFFTLSVHVIVFFGYTLSAFLQLNICAFVESTLKCVNQTILFSLRHPSNPGKHKWILPKSQCTICIQFCLQFSKWAGGAKEGATVRANASTFCSSGHTPSIVTFGNIFGESTSPTFPVFRSASQIPKCGQFTNSGNF